MFNNIALNLGGSWDAGGVTVPGTGDVMLWNSTFVDTVSAAGSLSTMGANASVQGIKITDVGGTRHQTNRFIGFQNPSSANTLTIGASGIDASAALQSFFAQSRVTLGANQTWNVGNANTAVNPTGFNNSEDICFQALAAAAPFDFGGRTLTTTGAGQITITGGYTLSNGTLDVGNNFITIQGGNSRVTTLTNTLNLIVSSGTLRLQGNSGVGGVSLTSAAPITVNGGTLSLRVNTAGLSTTQSGNITLAGGTSLDYQLDNAGTCTTSGNIAVNGAINLRVAGGGNLSANITGAISGSGNITYLNTATAANGFCRLAGNNSGYSGTITLSGGSNNRSLRLAAATAGSAAATWNVGAANTLQVDGVSVQLGTLQGSGTVTNSSVTAGATLNVGAGLFSGVITNSGTTPFHPTALTKVGGGTLVLGGANTFTGATTVSGGTLLSTPLHTGAGAVTVADSATFGVTLATVDTTYQASTTTLGSATGATLQVDYGSLPNPTAAAVATTDLLVNGVANGSTLRIAGKNLIAGTFPVVQYTTIGGSAGFAGLSLALPPRTTGFLTDTGFGIINATISTTEQVKWKGDQSDDWDVDPDGTGTIGTPNWVTTVGNAATRYLQGTGGTDIVTFDDSADDAGTVTVNLTTTLSPLGLTVSNPTKDYVFSGSGKLSGTVGLEKSGNGSLTIANTTANDYSGGTVINAGGALKLGDGVTAGAGVIAGSIANEGTLVLNRPDDHNLTNTLTGLGTLEKAQTNVVTVPALTTLDGPVELTAGKLTFSAGATLSGIVSGGGELEAAGGTVRLQGTDPNTNNGLVTVSAGILQLAKPEDVNAVGGDIAITGGATIQILANGQIPDTATISALGTSIDSLAGSTGIETFANAVLSGSVPTMQMILRNTPTITGTATINQGILSIGSLQTATVNAIVMTSPTAILRLAANTGASTLNIGGGGLTASAGVVEVKINGNDQDAIVNLAGDVTTTGNLAINNAGYAGGFQNIINLDGARSFNIGDATTTTVSPDIGGTGSLAKTGTGTLTLTDLCAAAPGGGTTVSAGTLLMNGSLAGTVQVGAAGTLGGIGELLGATTVDGTVSPGLSVGQLNSSGAVTFAPDSDFACEIGGWIGVTPGVDWDLLAANSLVFTATPSNKLTIHVSGTPAGFSESDKTLVIATSVVPVTGFDAAAIDIDATGFSGAGTWAVQLTGNNVELVYTGTIGTAYEEWTEDAGLNSGNNAFTDDPDNDGLDNIVEFALDGLPLSGTASGKLVGKVATVGGEEVLTLTLPVRGTIETVTFTGATEQSAEVDGIVYRIQGGNDLGGWPLVVSEVTGPEAAAIQLDLPPLSTGWVYRTFRTPGPVTADPKEFIRVVIDPAAAS